MLLSIIVFTFRHLCPSAKHKSVPKLPFFAVLFKAPRSISIHFSCKGVVFYVPPCPSLHPGIHRVAAKDASVHVLQSWPFLRTLQVQIPAALPFLLHITKAVYCCLLRKKVSRQVKYCFSRSAHLVRHSPNFEINVAPTHADRGITRAWPDGQLPQVLCQGGDRSVLIGLHPSYIGVVGGFAPTVPPPVEASLGEKPRFWVYILMPLVSV